MNKILFRGFRLFTLSLFFCIVFVNAISYEIPRKRQRGPAEATRWRERAMRDEYGRLTPDGRTKALQQLNDNLNYLGNQKTESAVSENWTARGPIDRGGRARSLVVHPRDPQILWAAAGSGGLWKSEDAGATWRPVADKLGLPAGSLVMDPQNPDILYFGTGERFHTGGPGAGIFVSRDGGETWKRLAATRKWRYVPSIAISPTNSNVLLATNADPEFPTLAGVYRSANGGKSWTKVIQSDLLLTPSALRFQPGSGSRVLLSIREGLFPSGESRVMVSDDTGITWRRSSGIGTTAFTRYEIAYASSRPQIAYAISREGTYRSVDGGESFTQRSGDVNFGLVSWAGMLWVSPTDPDLLLAGGVHLARSRDGGSSWKPVNYSDERARDIGHVDYHAAVADPRFGLSGNRQVYILNDGGIDRIDDVEAGKLRSKHASSLDHGMQTTEYYAVAGRFKDGLILGAAHDRGVLGNNLGSTQTTLEMGGDGACVLIDPSNSRYQYGCSQFLWISRLRPNGLIDLTNDLPDSNPVSEQRANFIAPVLLDPNAPNRMLAGGTSLWRSENIRKSTHDFGNRTTWAAIKPPVLRSFAGDDGHLISAIAVATGDSNHIWVAHNDGRLFHTRNGLAATPTWETIDDNAGLNPLPNRWPSRILLDTSNPQRVFVSFGGFTAGNLWRSNDGGISWRAASGTGKGALPSAPVWSLVQHPLKSNTLIAGTEVGVFITRNGGKSWEAIRAPFTAAAQDLSFLQGSTMLLVGTFGRGLWTIDVEGD